MRFRFFLLVIISIFFVISFFHLDTLPAEWFGDISNLHEYVLDIQKGKWPISYRQGVGPLYHYVITPVVSVTNQRYIDYKRLSVFWGSVSLLLVMVFVKEITNKKTAIISGGLLACSFWLIVWSRLGNLHASIPGLVALCFYFFERWRKYNQQQDLMFGAVVSCLGPFLYIPLVMLPITYFFIAIIHVICFSRKAINSSGWIPAFAGMTAIIFSAGLFFVGVVLSDPAEFINPRGYMAEKLSSLQTMNPQEFMVRFIVYTAKTINMFFFEGDRVFRVNVPSKPIIDPITSVFMLLGIYLFVRKKQFRIYLFPCVLLYLPSVFPSIQTVQIPSSTRTITLLPFVFLFAGYGATKVMEVFSHPFVRVLFVLLVMVAGIYNLYQYFGVYPRTLPNHNVGYGNIIAKYIDTLPPSVHVYMGDCCWGEWGQPEPKGIYYQLQKKSGRETLLRSFVGQCTDIIRPAIVFDSGKISQPLCPQSSQTWITEPGGQNVSRVTTYL